MKRPILIGTAELLPSPRVPVVVQYMLDNEGIYVGCDPGDESKGEAPLVSMGGKIYAVVLDRELDPARFIPGTHIAGPFRGNSTPRSVIS